MNTPKGRKVKLEKELHRQIQDQVLDIIQESGKSMVEVARDAGIGRTSLYRLAGEVKADFAMQSLIILADSMGYDVEVKLVRRGRK